MPDPIRLIINVNDYKNSFVFWNGTGKYYKLLRLAYKDILNDNKSEYLHFSFFTLCACTLEYSLNYILTDYCINKFGPDDYKGYAEGYIGLSFPKKLLLSPNIISDGQLVWREDSKSFKNLNSLISLQNKILHNKDFLKSLEFPDLNERVNEDEINFTITVEENHIETLSKEKCIDFGNSIGDFKKYIMTPYMKNELKENNALRKT